MGLTVASNIPAVTQNDITTSSLFRDYRGRAARFGWELHSITVEWAYTRKLADNKVQIVLMFAEVSGIDEKGREFRTGTLLRGETVEILPIIIDPDGVRHVVLVEQPRGAIGSNVVSTPAGMVEKKGPRLTALDELAEELGIKLDWSEPKSLLELAMVSKVPLCVTPGGSDERAHFFWTEATVDGKTFERLRNSTGGLAEEGEHTEVIILPYNGFLASYNLLTSMPDSKTVTAYLLHWYVTMCDFH